MGSLTIDFAASGNGREYQKSGWSGPEVEFTWAVGGRSELGALPAISGDRQLLTIDLFPFQPRRGPSTPKRLTVKTCEAVLWDGRIDGRVFLKVITPPGVEVAQSIEFLHPDFDYPNAHGEEDVRPLAFAFRHMHIEPLVTAPALTPRSNVSAVPATEAEEDVGSVIADITQTRQGRAELTSRLICSQYSVEATVNVSDERSDDFSVIEVVYKPSGAWEFNFPASLADDVNSAAGLVVKHWLFTMPLFAAFQSKQRVCGAQRLSLGDEAHGPGLSFCNHSGDLLLPDPIFLISRAHRITRWRIEGGWVDWPDRLDMAIWRGSSTGYRQHPNIRELDRIKLCELSRESSAAGLLDAGLTQLVQLRSDEERKELLDLGVIRPYMPPERFACYKYVIDIDGNTNSWPGLFTKLLTGSTVLKVTSVGGWRQWYYDRLQPFVHFVPVRSDLADLLEKIEWLRSNNNLAQAIGQRGRELALSMKFAAEVELGCQTVESGFLDLFRFGGSQAVG